MPPDRLLDPAAFRTLLSLAWPIVIARASQVVIGFCDAWLTARLGEDALAATSAGAMNTFNLLILPMGVVFIVQSYASQHTGRGEPGAARRFAWYGLALSAFMQLVAVASMPFVEPLVRLFGLSENVTTLMSAYLRIRVLCAGAAVGMEAVGNYYGGLGNTRQPMLAGVLAMVLNVALAALFIFGAGPVPAMGVEGAAWAAVLATWVAFGWIFWCFWTGRGASAAQVDGHLQWAELWRMLRFGIPNGFNWFFEFAAFSLFINVIIGGLGTTVLAAFMALLQLSSMAFMPAFGLASAASIQAGQSLGAGEPDKVPRHLARAVVVGQVWQFLVGAVYLLFPVALLGLFARDGAVDSPLVTVGAPLLLISVAWQSFDSAAVIIAETLRAAGDTAFCMWARLIISWAVILPGGWYTVRVRGGDHIAATWWIVLYLALLSGVLAWRFLRGHWRSIQLTGDAPAVH